MMGETIVFEFDVEFYRSLPNVNFTVEITRKEMGIRVLQLQNDDCGFAVQRDRARQAAVQSGNPQLHALSDFVRNYDLHLGCGEDI